MATISLSFTTSDIQKIINNASPGLAGLAFAKNIVAGVDQGFRPPFTPRVYYIYYDSIQGYYYNLHQPVLPTLHAAGGGSSLYGSKTLRGSLNPSDQIEFTDNASFYNFAFSFFPIDTINVMLDSSDGIIISGALIEPGTGSEASVSGVNDFFTLKMAPIRITGTSSSSTSSATASSESTTSSAAEAADDGNNYEGTPEFVLGVPCPPDWATS